MAALLTSSGRPGFYLRVLEEFRPLRISRIDRECIDVISLSLQPTEGRRLTTPLPGQFVVLRLRPTPKGPPLFRSY